MVDITIYSKNGTEKAVVKTLEYDGNFMGDRFVTVSVSSPTVIDWAIGDYLDYRGERWTLWLLPATSKTARVRSYGGAIEYKDLRFCPNEEELRRCSFLDVVKSDNEIHYTSLPNFSFYCSRAQDLADRIQANLDRLYPGLWIVEANEAASITDQSLTFSENSCWDALVTANTTLGLNFIIDSAARTITIGGEGFFIETVMQYGEGNGLKSVERTVDDNQQVINRLYAYGNTRNLPYRYYNKRYAAGSSVFDMVQSMYLPNLMLPGICKGWAASEATGYLDANGCVYKDYGAEGQELTYNSSTHWYNNPDGSAYVGTIYRYWKHYSLSTDRTMYYCDRVWIESSDSVSKCGIQEGTKFFDGSDELTEDIYPSLTGFDSTADLASALGQQQASAQNLSYEQGALDEIMGAIVDSWDGIIPEEEEATPTFSIRIKNIGFDLGDAELDASGDTPRLSMKSGMCAGREFNILECKKQVQRNGAWEDYNPSSPVSGQWSYLLTCEVAADESIGQYFPNNSFTLAPGDRFVILGIKMPDVYVDVAENRLLKVAIVWLSENDKTSYSYMPAINNIYMKDNPETSALLKEGNILHVYDEDLGIDVEMTISNLKIKNDKQIPEFEVTLSNDKEADLVQRVTAQVRQSFTQFIGSGKGSGSGIYLIGTTSNAAPTDNNAFSARRSLNMFLRKDVDDTAAGRITLEEGFNSAERGNFGDFLSGLFGRGGQIDKHGHAELDSLDIRGSLRASEFIFNKISAEEGEAIRSIGRGQIHTVTPTSDTQGTATLRMEGDELPTIEEGDICRGMYNTVFGETQQLFDGDDVNGFRTKKGFFTSYFYIVSISSTTTQDGDATIYTFTYALQNANTPHPVPNMNFAVYGNFDDTKPERQSCIYITSIGMAPRLLMLAGVNTWAFSKHNIKIALGNIEGLTVRAIDENSQGYDKVLHGDAGIYVEDNIYFGGILNQFTTEDYDYLKYRLGSNYTAQLTRGSDNIVVDAVGNVVGGLTKTVNGNTVYRLQTGVTIFDSYHDCYMTVNGLENNEDVSEIGDTEFAMFATATGCQIEIEGADVRVVSIDNVTGASTDAELATMRDTQECSIKIIVQTNTGWTTQLTYPIKITHLDKSYITFDLDNEMDMMSYRSQTKRYDGLPLSTQLHAYKDGVTHALTNIKATDAAGVVHTVTSANSPITWPWTYDDNGTTVATGLQWTLAIDGTLTLSHVSNSGDEVDLPDDKHFMRLQCSAKYAGVTYTSPVKTFTLQEKTDTSICRLILSAGAVVKTGSAFVPDTVAVQVSVSSATGRAIFNDTTDAALAAVGLKVRYIDGTYTPGNSWAVPTGAVSSMPAFASVQSNAITVLLIEAASNTVVDVESIPLSAVGRDGAGQPYIVSNVDSYPVDCDEDGKILNSDTLSLESSLKFGDEVCTLTTATVEYGGTTYNALTQTSTTVASADLGFDADDTLTSGYAIITLTGTTTNNGVTTAHSATKTVAILANRRGPTGQTGRKGSNGVAVVFDLDNEMDGMSFNTATSRYTGLPITTHMTVKADGVAQDLDELELVFVDGSTTRTLTAAQNHDTDDVVWTAANLLVSIDRDTGAMTIDHRGSSYTETDIADGRVQFILTGSVAIGGHNYSTSKVFTLREQTDTTIYRLLLSANSISKDANTYTPNSIDVTVSATSDAGTSILSIANLPANLAVWYLDGAYIPGTTTWATMAQAQSNPPAMPSFADVQSGVVTVLLVDTTAEAILDVESVPITAVGRDGAGQPYIYTNIDQIVIDCNADGVITAPTQQINVVASLRYGDQNCLITGGSWTRNGVTNQFMLVGDNYSVTERFNFTQGNSLASNRAIVTINGTDTNGDTHSATKTISIIANRSGVTGKTGATLRFRGVWDANITYVWNDEFRDAVKYQGVYYIVNEYNGTSLGTPGNDETKWMSLGGQEFIATGLLLAESAIIDLLSSNVIRTRDNLGNITSTINEDGHGSFVQYYPSGRPMMNYCYDGYIYRYNDVEGSTVAWKIGLGGDIEKNTTDQWRDCYLHGLRSTYLELDPVPRLNAAQPIQVTGSENFTRTHYYRFFSGSGGTWAAYNGIIYTLNNGNPATNGSNIIPDGWYTPNQNGYSVLTEDGETFVLEVWKVVNGRVTQIKEVTYY